MNRTTRTIRGTKVIFGDHRRAPLGNLNRTQYLTPPPGKGPIKRFEIITQPTRHATNKGHNSR